MAYYTNEGTPKEEPKCWYDGKPCDGACDVERYCSDCPIVKAIRD